MPHSIHANRANRQRGCLLAVAALVSGVLVAGCGGSSPSPTTASGSATATRSSTASVASAGPGAGPPNGLAFAQCMRSNGVPNFPDPPAGGGFVFHTAGLNIASPAFQAARARCQKFAPMPPGAGGSSSSPQEMAQALAQLRTVTQVHAPARYLAVPRPQGHAPAPTSAWASTPKSPTTKECSFSSRPRSTCSRPRGSRRRPHAAPSPRASATRTTDRARVDAGNATGSSPSPRRRRLRLALGLLLATGVVVAIVLGTRSSLASGDRGPGQRRASRRPCSGATWSRPTPSRAHSPTPDPKPSTTASAGQSPGCLPSGG